MNLVDALLVLVIVWGAYSGWRRGFLLTAIELASLILSVLFAFKSYPYLARFFEKHTSVLGVWTLPLAFILCFAAARIVLGVLEGAFFRNIPAQAQRRPLNRMLGIFPGTVNGLINAAVLAAILLAAPIFDGLSVKTRESKVATRLMPAVEWAEEKAAPVFDEAIQHSLSAMTVETGSKESTRLPFKKEQAAPRPMLEQQMLAMVNEERAKEGLQPLKADTAMRRIARAHSLDMLRRGYFSHYSPDGKSLVDRARAAHIGYLIAGENLALAPTLEMAHRGLMKSPGHRANILQPRFGRVGIGVMDAGRYGVMVTQDFRN